jgi:S-adenosylmethionine hydrolase
MCPADQSDDTSRGVAVVPGRIEGTIKSVSKAGNLITDISVEQLRDAPTDERVTVCCDDHETNGLFPPDHDQPAATLLAVLGSSGFLELEIVGDSAQIMLGVAIGEKVEVRW